MKSSPFLLGVEGKPQVKCHENGANPASLLSVFAANTAYRLNVQGLYSLRWCKCRYRPQSGWAAPRRIRILHRSGHLLGRHCPQVRPKQIRVLQNGRGRLSWRAPRSPSGWESPSGRSAYGLSSRRSRPSNWATSGGSARMKCVAGSKSAHRSRPENGNRP